MKPSYLHLCPLFSQSKHPYSTEDHTSTSLWSYLCSPSQGVPRQRCSLLQYQWLPFHSTKHHLDPKRASLPYFTFLSGTSPSFVLSRQSSQRQRQCLLLPACLLCCSLYSKHATETSLQLPNDLHATNLEVFVANLSITFKAQNCPLPFGWLLANPVFPSWFLSCEHTFD